MPAASTKSILARVLKPKPEPSSPFFDLKIMRTPTCILRIEILLSPG
jgi:hypothetical protein